MDDRIKFLEGKLKYLQGQLTTNLLFKQITTNLLFNRHTQTLVHKDLTDEVNHITNRIRHYLVHLHTKCETMDDFIEKCQEKSHALAW